MLVAGAIGVLLRVRRKAKFTTDDFGIRVGDYSSELVLSIVLEADGSRIAVDLSGTESVRSRADH